MKTEDIQIELTNISRDVKKLLGSLTAEQLNWKPSPNAWCIGQILEHIIIVNGSYFPIFKEIQNKTYTVPIYAKLKALASFNGKMVLKSVDPEEKRKTKTFPLWKPKQVVYKTTIISEFLRHQENLISEIGKTLSACNQHHVIILSPGNRLIFYSLENAIRIIINHEKRHLNQVDFLLDAIGQKK